ncbi:uncharacterized protein B0T23DRAFT_135749 [Neurospora hispaniola]|uniref:Uncharacterized protein n=1 Tax=Neurospora hispaniola TaxID=588809 RepID=A0AAJ0MR75_9PEZI|nr:hypothetical protein B0T23DRAFT_135749 [Neurospora hispaniola]
MAADPCPPFSPLALVRGSGTNPVHAVPFHARRHHRGMPNTAAFCSRRDNSGAEKMMHRASKSPSAAQHNVWIPQTPAPPSSIRGRSRDCNRRPGVTVCTPVRAGTYATHRAAASARFSPKETDGRIGETEKDKRVQAACTAPSRLDQLLPPSVLFGVGRTRQIGPSHPLHFCQGVRLCDEKRRLRCHAAIVHSWLVSRVCLLEFS